MKIQLTESQKEFLNALGTKITFPAESWYYFPFWFKENQDGSFEQITFEHLPQYVKDQILERREK